MRTVFMLKAILLLLIFIACSKTKEDVHYDSTAPLFLKVDKGGCFNNLGANLKIGKLNKDTLFYEIKNDTLVLFFNMARNCAACLVDSVSILDEQVKIYIKNDCGPFANCICNFEYSYNFDNYSGKEMLFSVYYKGYQESEFSLWNEIKYP